VDSEACSEEKPTTAEQKC